AVAALPVVPCPTSYAAGNNPHPFVPNELPAAVPARGLRFYSNGLMTVLGPAGWACSALVAADGGELLDVYPPGQPDLSVTVISPGSQVVQLEVDYTGHGPGAGLICPLFPDSPAATFESGLPCPTLPPAESTLRLTDDVVAFSDPPGVRGTGAGSGGPLRSLGDAVYPQVKPAEPPGGVTVAVLSCTLASNVDPLCMSIQADFLVRQAPVYKGSQG
ncbi:MAG TPA: hypothetical protein VN799_08045, partial [Acidimicrobiales bacterium]|nr:hypothetical protein [Acidimicrobiales bacterium]